MYRECIDRVHNAALTGADDSEQDEKRVSVPTVTLSQLKDSVEDGKSVITEIDVVSVVLEVVKREIESKHFSSEESPHVLDLGYLLTVSVAYAHSLLSVLIYPHKRLQLFLLSLATESGHFNTLHQLLNFHVLMDSTELLENLEIIDARYGEQYSWISMARLDMAMRMGRTDQVIDCLIKQDRAIAIVEYIRRFDPSYDIEHLFLILKERKVSWKMIWEQIESWSMRPGLAQSEKPVLPRNLILMNTEE